MTKKKSDGATPELEQANLDVLIEALAKVTAKLGTDAELRKHVVDVKGQVETLADKLTQQADDVQAREAIAGDVEKLVEQIGTTGKAAGNELDKHRQPIAQAFAGMDIAQAANVLSMIAGWLQDPTPEGRAKIEAMVDQLKQTMGPLVGYDPEREDEQRRADIKKDVQASLDEIFRPKKKP